MALAPESNSTDTRAKLVAAAARVFVRRGFDGATVREIAEDAGFTNPVLYYHFGSKGRLYEAVILDSFERFERLIREALAAAPEPLERLRAFAAACLTYARQDPIQLRILYQEIFRPSEGDSEPLNLRFDAMRSWSRGQIETLLAELASSGAARISDLALSMRIFIALLGGLLLEQAREPDQPLAEETLSNVVVQVFLRGIEGLEADR